MQTSFAPTIVRESGRTNTHVEIAPDAPPDPVSEEELAAYLHRLIDTDQAIAAVRLALWPGWWSLDMTGLGQDPVVRAARRAWAVGPGSDEEAAATPGFVVLVYDLDTAERLRIEGVRG